MEKESSRRPIVRLAILIGLNILITLTMRNGVSDSLTHFLIACIGVSFFLLTCLLMEGVATRFIMNVGVNQLCCYTV